MIELQYDDATRRCMDLTHSSRWIVEGSHTVDPSVLVVAAKIGKPECCNKGVVTGTPIVDLECVYRNYNMWTAGRGHGLLCSAVV